MRIHHTISIHAAMQDVWAATIDIERLPQLTPTMTSVERLDDGPLDVGCRARIKQPGQPGRVWTVTELDAPRRFVWSTKAMGMSMTAIHDLDAQPAGTDCTLTIEVTGLTSRLLGPLMRRPIRRALSQENDGLKAAAEAAAVNSSGDRDTRSRPPC